MPKFPEVNKKNVEMPRREANVKRRLKVKDAKMSMFVLSSGTRCGLPHILFIVTADRSKDKPMPQLFAKRAPSKSRTKQMAKRAMYLSREKEKVKVQKAKDNAVKAGAMDEE